MCKGNKSKQSAGDFNNSHVSGVNYNSQANVVNNHYRSDKHNQQLVKWLLVVNCIFAMVNLCVAFPYDGLGFDYMGIIVAIFSVLVTALVCWQIVGTINHKSELRELQAETEKLRNEKLSSMFSGMVHLGDAIAAIPTNTDEQKEMLGDMALRSYFYALVYLNEDVPTEIKNELYGETLKNLKKLFKERQECSISASPDMQQMFYLAALKTQDKELIQYARNIEIIKS